MNCAERWNTEKPANPRRPWESWEDDSVKAPPDPDLVAKPVVVTTIGPMTRFRKRPIIVEAFQYGVTPEVDLPAWAKDAISRELVKPFTAEAGSLRWAEIETLEGTMRANYGDWIIKGIKGEFYPCKPDVFMRLYEPVEYVCP